MLRKECHVGSTIWTGFPLTVNTARDISDVAAGCANPANGFTNRHGRIAKKLRGAGELSRITGLVGIKTVNMNRN